MVAALGSAKGSSTLEVRQPHLYTDLLSLLL